MKFNPRLRPEEIASVDVTRRHLCNTWFDKNAGRLVATNGHMIIAVPCEAEPGDTTGPVPKDAIVSARRRKDKEGKSRIRLAKRLADDGKALHRREQNVQYPPWETVIRPGFKQGDKGTVTFAVNPHYLVALARASGGAGGYSPSVKITVKVTSEMLDAIIVSASNGDQAVEAIVMPGRM
jgi:hypothetical protein